MFSLRLWGEKINMPRIVKPRCVLAVRDLEVSTRYYIDVLGFRKDPSTLRLDLYMATTARDWTKED